MGIMGIMGGMGIFFYPIIPIIPIIPILPINLVVNPANKKESQPRKNSTVIQKYLAYFS